MSARVLSSARLASFPAGEGGCSVCSPVPIGLRVTPELAKSGSCFAGLFAESSSSSVGPPSIQELISSTFS